MTHRFLKTWAGLIVLVGVLASPGRAAQTIVSLTFDDGFSDAPTASQILGQFGYKGTFYIISGVLGTPDYMTQAQVKALSNAGHEIGGHTITHPDLTTLTTAQAQVEICTGRNQLVALGYQPVSFAYPYGASNAAIEAIVKSCYQNARRAWQLGCTYSGCAAAETIPPVDPYWIRTPDAVVYTTTLAQLEQQVTVAENAGGGWVPLQFHHVCDGCDGKSANGYSISPSTLTAFLTWLQARAGQGTIVKTVKDVMTTGSSGGTSSATTIFGNSVPTDGYKDPSPLEVGVKFRSDVNAIVTGVRFYKGSSNTGTHSGHLWTKAGAPLASATFVGETTSGWQSVLFSSPVAITANTTYVASYFTTTGYSVDSAYFATKAADNPPLHALQNGTDGPNGLFLYGAASAFPTDSYNSANYWVDVIVTTGTQTAPSNPVPVLSSLAPSSATAGTSAFTLQVNGSNFISSSTVQWNGAARTTLFVNSGRLSATISAADIASAGNAAVSVFTPAPGGGTSTSLPFTIAAATQAANPVPVLSAIVPSSATAGTSAFTLTLNGSNFISSSMVKWNGAARATTFVTSGKLTAAIPASDIAAVGSGAVTVFTPAPGGGTSASLPFMVTASTVSSGPCPCTIWMSSAPAAGDGWKDPSPLEVGVRFRADANGYITGMRFYKWSTNTGTHTGHLWSNTGTLLATVTFTGESATGWQVAYFSNPVAVTANTTYVASYFTTTGYAVTTKYFATAGVDNAPLHALKSGVDGLNGIYIYSAAAAFPTSSTNTSNYWVDVVFNTSPVSGGIISHSLGQPGVLLPAAGAWADLSQVRVYPNPWKLSLGNGKKITFDQMPPNSSVKIFTLSAHWIKTLDAPAGSAAWDLTNDSGDEAASGFYFYLITTSQGQKSHGTFAIIR